MDVPSPEAHLLEMLDLLWPDARVDSAELSAFLSGKLSGEAEGEMLPNGADLLLALQCSRGVPRALARFEELLVGMGGELSRSLTREQADDVLQRVRERVLLRIGGRPPAILDYAGRGSLQAWLRVAALRTASNLRRESASRAKQVVQDSELWSLQISDPELALLKGREGKLLAASIREAFQELSTQERNLLRLHLVDGLGLDRLSRLLGVHRATAARQVAGARAALRERVIAKLQEHLQLDAVELRSWLRLVRSELSVSAAGLLKEP